MPAANLQPSLPEQIAQHPVAGKRVIQVQLIDLAHQPQVPGGDCPRPVVDAAAADIEHLGLFLDGKIVLRVDHRFTLSNPALVSAPSRKKQILSAYAETG
jgi:hypothetical protein